METAGKESVKDLPVLLKSGHKTSQEKDTLAQEEILSMETRE